MKRLALALAILCSSAMVTVAQTKPSTDAGSNALLFSINGFGDFGVGGPIVGTTPLGDTTFNMLGQMLGVRLVRPVYGIGMKFFLADDVALRVGLGFNYSAETTENVVRNRDTADETETKMAFGIAPALEIHLVQAGPVSFYTGAQVSFATARSASERDTNEVGNSQMGISVGGLLGAEFFPWENVSLGAEYQAGLTFSSASTESGGKSYDGPSTVEFGIAGPLRITLGLHF